MVFNCQPITENFAKNLEYVSFNYTIFFRLIFLIKNFYINYL